MPTSHRPPPLRDFPFHKLLILHRACIELVYVTENSDAFIGSPGYRSMLDAGLVSTGRSAIREPLENKRCDETALLLPLAAALNAYLFSHEPNRLTWRAE